MSQIEIGRTYEVNSDEAYSDLVGFTSIVVDEIQVREEVDDETVKVHQLDMAKGEGTYNDVSINTLEQLLNGGYIEER